MTENTNEHEDDASVTQPVYTDELAKSLKIAEEYAGKFGYTVGPTPETPMFIGIISGYEIFGASQPTVAAPIAQVSGGTDELADSLKIAEEYADKFGYTVGPTPETPMFIGIISGYEIFGASQTPDAKTDKKLKQAEVNKQINGRWECKQHGSECKSYAGLWAIELNKQGITPKTLQDTDAKGVLIWAESY